MLDFILLSIIAFWINKFLIKFTLILVFSYSVVKVQKFFDGLFLFSLEERKLSSFCYLFSFSISVLNLRTILWLLIFLTQTF